MPSISARREPPNGGATGFHQEADGPKNLFRNLYDRTCRAPMGEE